MIAFSVCVCTAGVRIVIDQLLTPLTEPHTLCVQTEQSGLGWRSYENMNLCADLWT